MAEVLDELTDGVLRLTINLPERRNPMTFEVLRSLLGHFTAARERPEVRVIVLEGEGGRAFCAGGDLSNMDGKQDDVLPAHCARGRPVPAASMETDVAELAATSAVEPPNTPAAAPGQLLPDPGHALSGRCTARGASP